MEANTLASDLGWLAKYQTQGPRYTSYPTADRFHAPFEVERYKTALTEHNTRFADQSLSLYLHMPFCSHLCFYCGCNKIITKDKTRGEVYLRYLERELALYEPLLGERRGVKQLHLGGGTPTFFSLAQLEWLMQRLQSTFRFAGDGEYSIEIDPRTVAASEMERLRAIGFNRASLGVQDFDPAVQQAVHRVQSQAMTLELIEATRKAGFVSTSVDLIYGLPKQTLAGFERTLDAIVSARPDRIALYGYAHLPSLFYPQTRIDERDLPSTEQKLAIMQRAIAHLLEAGYVYIGMDHFAHPDDELAVAQRDGALQRNFQGYSTHGGHDMLALGVSAISFMGGIYSQNHKTDSDYYKSLSEDTLPIMRGYWLTQDDRLRAAVIQSIMCQGAVAQSELEREFEVDFDAYFATELGELQPFIAEGLLERRSEGLRVTPVGRFVLRNIAMLFDAHLRRARQSPERERQRYSKVL